MNPLHSVPGTIFAGIALSAVIAAATLGIEPNPASLLLWVHALGGILWVGLLYYFSFVQAGALAAAAADEAGPGGAGIVKYEAPRALLWMRWGAIVTWLSGAGYLLLRGLLDDAFSLGLVGDPVAGLTIGIGAWLGTIMLLNVWLLIAPNQKRALGLVEATPEEILRSRRVAFVASRVNAVLSLPMLMSMVGFGHGGFFV